MVRLTIPGTLDYRDLAVRVVAAVCKLARPSTGDAHAFDDHVISAFGEAFNNIAVHGYRHRPVGEVELELEFDRVALTLILRDHGQPFDFDHAPDPAPGTLRESGFGLYIIRSFMDQVVYRPATQAGAPNVLHMTKRR